MTTETAEPSNLSHRPLTLLEVRASGVHGRGVYTTSFIAKGTCLIEYTGKRVLWKDIPEDLDGPHTFLFGLDDGIHVIDPEIGGNEARWINHSCEPNCEAIEDEEDRVFIYALRAIQPGEELFYDYALEVDEPRTKELEQESPCYCGARNCRGTLLAAKRNLGRACVLSIALRAGRSVASLIQQQLTTARASNLLLALAKLKPFEVRRAMKRGAD